MANDALQSDYRDRVVFTHVVHIADSGIFKASFSVSRQVADAWVFEHEGMVEQDLDSDENARLAATTAAHDWIDRDSA